jgi:hypothetical protein
MRRVSAIFVVFSMLLALPATAQKPEQTPTQFYNEYRAAWMKTTSMNTLLPYVSKDSRAQYETTPQEQRQPMFTMMKEMATVTDFKVVRETKTASGYTLELSGTRPENKPATGTAEIVVEGGALKLKKESWNM